MSQKEKKCCQCQKEITSGKFYNFFTGKKGGRRLVQYLQPGDNFFCPVCAHQEKNDLDNPYVPDGNLLEIEWEVGNSTDEQILEFEENWRKYYVNNQFIKEDANTDEKSILAWCQKTKQELEPYLQKPDIVEKSFGGGRLKVSVKNIIIFIICSLSRQKMRIIEKQWLNRPWRKF